MLPLQRFLLLEEPFLLLERLKCFKLLMMLCNIWIVSFLKQSVKFTKAPWMLGVITWVLLMNHISVQSLLDLMVMVNLSLLDIIEEKERIHMNLCECGGSVVSNWIESSGVWHCICEACFREWVE